MSQNVINVAAETNYNTNASRCTLLTPSLSIQPAENNDTDNNLMLNNDNFASTLYKLLTEERTNLTAEAYLVFLDDDTDHHSVVDNPSPALVLPEKQEGSAVSKQTYKDRCAEKWEQRFHELERYKSVHGHCNVPQKYILNPRLGRWLAQQRISMRKAKCESKPGGKGGKTMLERVHRLKEIGVFPSIGTGQINKKGSHFKSSCYNNSLWERQFESLLCFKEMHGHCNVPTMGKGEFQSLGRWVSAQRKQYKDICSNHNEKSVGDEGRGELIYRFQRLKNIGFRIQAK